MLQIEWIVSDEQRKMLEPYIRRALCVAPPWLRSMSVRYDPHEADGMMRISVLEEYRTANIVVANEHFAAGAGDQRINLVHEVAHLHFARLADVYRDIVESLTDKDSKERAIAESLWRRAEEACVTDLSRTLDALLPPAEP